MGYESKILLVNRHESKTRFDGTTLERPIINAEIVAEYDLCKMGCQAQEFYAAFRREIDYTLFLPGVDANGDERIMEKDEDMYGDHLKSANIEELLAALKACEERDHYRRLPPLIAMLETLANMRDEWPVLEAVHYGY